MVVEGIDDVELSSNISAVEPNISMLEFVRPFHPHGPATMRRILQ